MGAFAYFEGERAAGGFSGTTDAARYYGIGVPAGTYTLTISKTRAAACPDPQPSTPCPGTRGARRCTAPERTAMLKYRLIHPPLLQVLAAAGHGSTILLADSNFAHSTNAYAGARRIHLNLCPGLLTVDQVLECIADACPIESAATMRPDDGSEAAAVAGYARLLGDGIAITAFERARFYQACRLPDLAAVVATGDQRHYANILLTIGAVPPPDEHPLTTR